MKFDREIVKAIIAEVGIENLDNLMVETESSIYLLREDEELNSFFWNNGHTIVYGKDFDFDDDPMTLIFKPHNNGEKIKRKLKNSCRKNILTIT